MSEAFQSLPLWLMFPVSLALIIAANEAGRLVRGWSGVRKDENLQTLEAAILGLLALMVSFTFAMSLSHFDDRRIAVLNEANAIGTTALRARLLPPPHNREVLGLLRDYTQLRLDFTGSAGGEAELARLIERSNALQEALWQQARAAMARDAGMVPTGIFIQSLNETIDSQQKRIVAYRMRIPVLVLIALYGMTFVAAGAIGYAGGLQPRRIGRPTYVIFVLFAGLMVLVQDLDRPNAGYVMVDQQPMIDTAKSLAGYRD